MSIKYLISTLVHISMDSILIGFSEYFPKDKNQIINVGLIPMFLLAMKINNKFKEPYRAACLYSFIKILYQVSNI